MSISSLFLEKVEFEYQDNFVHLIFEDQAEKFFS